MLGRKVVVFGPVVILAFIIVAIFASLIAPYDPYAQNLNVARYLNSKKLENIVADKIRDHVLTSENLTKLAEFVCQELNKKFGVISGRV
jgi:ABC-type dipeptide/oligopeptide/nickel transport system permease subunit